MINTQQLKLPQKYLEVIVVLVILCVSLVLRMQNPGNYAFGFDQVQILQKASEIAGGDFSLVGPRTGPADLFTGPLVYYLTAIFLLFSNHSPYALVGLSASVSLVTGVAIFALSRYVFDKTSALYVIALWAFSPLFIHFDRIAWNPLLSLLASSLIFFPVLKAIGQEKVRIVDLIFIFLGGFLGYQAHFSSIIFPPLILLSCLIFDRKKWWMFLVGSLGMLISIIPTLIFDLKQNWHNTNGFISFLLNKDKVETKFDLLRLFSDLKISFENLSKVLFFGMNGVFLIVFGVLLCFGVFIIIRKKTSSKRPLLYSMLWIWVTAFVFSFYREAKPDYYYMVTFPAVIIVIIEVMKHFLKKEVWQVTLVFFCIYGGIYTIWLENKVNGFGLEAQFTASKDIQSRILSGNVKNITYAMKPIDAQGIEYFVGLKPELLSSTGKKLVVLYPVSETRNVQSRYGAIGIWEDDRVDQTKHYLSREEYTIITPLNVQLYEDHYLPEMYDGNTVFRFMIDGLDSKQSLVVIKQADHTHKIFEEIQRQVVSTPWKEVEVDQYKGKALYMPESNVLFLLTTSGNDVVSPAVFMIE